MMSGLQVVEVCAGAGGQSLGLHLAGFQHRLAVEIDPQAATTLESNLLRLYANDADLATERPVVAVGDAANKDVWDPVKYEGVDLLAGGVPCPPFSVAGKQLGGSDERDLYAWAVSQACAIRPRALMLENVRGLSSPRFTGYRDHVEETLRAAGYEPFWRLLQASDFGVAQLRPRYVMVALASEYAPFFAWPDETPTSETVGTTLADLMASRGWRGAKGWAARADTIAPTIVGGSKKHGGADLGPTRAKAAWASLGVDGLGIADAAPDAEMPPGFIPKLTTEMVARLQGWLANDADYAWSFTGRKTSTYRQIGNAFPPPVARAVGGAIKDALLKVPLRRETVMDDAIRRDRVYVALQEAREWVTTRALLELVGPMTEQALSRRLAALSHDFVLDLRQTPDGTAYRLGAFKGFRGEEDHQRQMFFSDKRGRSRIS